MITLMIKIYAIGALLTLSHGVFIAYKTRNIMPDEHLPLMFRGVLVGAVIWPMFWFEMIRDLIDLYKEND